MSVTKQFGAVLFFIMAAHSLSDAAWLSSINGIPVNGILRKVDEADAAEKFVDVQGGYATFAELEAQSNASATTGISGKVYRVGSDMTCVANARFTFTKAGSDDAGFSFSVPRGLLQSASGTVEPSSLTAIFKGGDVQIPPVQAGVSTNNDNTLTRIIIQNVEGLTPDAAYTVVISGFIPFTSGPAPGAGDA